MRANGGLRTWEGPWKESAQQSTMLWEGSCNGGSGTSTVNGNVKKKG